jgi:WD40 repeat protein
LKSTSLLSTLFFILVSGVPDEASKVPDGAGNLLDNLESKLASSETPYFSFLPGGGDIIICEKRGVVTLNGATTRKNILLEAKTPGEYVWAWMSPDRKLLLVLNKKGKLTLAEVETKKITPLEEELPKGFKKCIFAPDGTYFVAIGGMKDSEMVYWQLGEDKKTVKNSGRSSFANRTTLYDGAFSSDGKVLATVSGSGFLILWSRPPLAPSTEGEKLAFNGGLSSIAFSRDDKTVAVGATIEKKITLIAPATGQKIKEIEWKKSDPLSGIKLAFLHHKNILACSEGNQIRLLDTDSGKSLGSVPAGGSVIRLGVSPDGRWLVAGTREKTVVFWRIKD